MEVLTTQLKEQATQIQQVSAQLEVSKQAPHVVANKPVKLRSRVAWCVKHQGEFRFFFLTPHLHFDTRRAYERPEMSSPMREIKEGQNN